MGETSTNVSGVEYNLSSNSLSNLLKASLVVEFEAPTSPLSLWNSHALVEVGRGLHVLPRLFLQLLTELFSLYSTNICYRDRKNENRCQKA